MTAAIIVTQSRKDVVENAGYDEQTIYDVFSSALLAGHLAPGAKLGEQRLAALFGVSRERLRKVLHRLKDNRLIEMIPNRGAFVAAPSLGEARLIYEARRILEGGIVVRLAERISPAQLDQLVEHLAAEERAHGRGDRPEAIRLSALFHMMLARMTGNDFIVRQMQELVSRTAMLVAFFERGSDERCGYDEHHAIADALMRRDAGEAARAMTTHLSLIETRLEPRSAAPVNESVEDVLRRLIQSHRSAAGSAGRRPKKGQLEATARVARSRPMSIPE